MTFASPYSMPPGTESQHICTVVNLPAPECAALGMTYHAASGTFVVTLGCMGAQGRNFYYATSADMLHWSEAAPFFSTADLPKNVSAMVTNINYPTLMDLSAPSAFSDNNFATVGSSPHLFWVSIGHRFALIFRWEDSPIATDT